MNQEPVIFALFLMFGGAALLSTLVLFTRQSLLVAYILLGMLLGPWGLSWFSDSSFILQIGNIGILFLLFLLGLHLDPQNLVKLLKKTTIVTVISSLSFALIGYLLGKRKDRYIPWLINWVENAFN